MTEKKVFLTIAGSDPSGGAGIQADIKTAVMLGLYPCSVITALTAQNTQGFRSADTVGADLIISQLSAVLEDFRPHAVKIGFLPDAKAVEVVADCCERYNLADIILDPILSPTLLKAEGREEVMIKIIERLLPISTLVTPNWEEFTAMENLSGTKLTLLCNAVLVKGGHTDGRDCIDTLYYHVDASSAQSLPSSAFPTIHNNSSILFHDSLIPEPSLCESAVISEEFRHKRIKTSNTHGTGCVLSSAIACYLAMGKPLPKAIAKAVNFLEKALDNSSRFNPGQGIYGPALI